MDRLLDARGLACPLPALKTRAALERLRTGDVLTVLTTDPEAPVDIGALAADGGHELTVEILQPVNEAHRAWRMLIVKR